MTDQKKPETIADEDLDTAQGGFASWGTGTLQVNAKQKKGDGFITFGAETGLAKDKDEDGFITFGTETGL